VREMRKYVIARPYASIAVPRVGAVADAAGKRRMGLIVALVATMKNLPEYQRLLLKHHIVND
jgi:hypothetical protein